MRRLRHFLLPILCLGLFAGQGNLWGQLLYWELPEPFSARQGTFPVSAIGKNLSALIWQETTASASGGRIDVNLAVKEQGRGWEQRGSVGSYYYSGTEPAILSAIIDSKDRILIAAAISASQTDILISDNGGRSFSRNQVQMGSESSVAPRIFTRADGGYLLFVTRGRDQTLSLFYSRSDDGTSWSDFQPFVAESGMLFNFLPTHAALGKNDYVIFQSQVSGEDQAPMFQLFLKSSSDNGRTWSASRRVTSFSNTRIAGSTPAGSSPNLFDNQRACLTVLNNNLFVVWERRSLTQSPQIYSAVLGEDGTIRGIPEQVNSSSDGYCNNPIPFPWENGMAVVWFDNTQGVFMGTQTTLGWSQSVNLSRGTEGGLSFARPIPTAEGLYIFWETVLRGSSRITILSPDITVQPPRLSAVNFTSGRRSRGSLARISWTVPPDSSGIEGFSWSWSRRAGDTPLRQVMQYNREGTILAEQTADEDGTWYFSVIARDFAGNWSEPARISYVRDTTPPPAAVIIDPETDGNGYLVSNTFDLRWNIPPASDIAGYTWNLEYLGPASLVPGTGDVMKAAAAERFPNLAPPPQTLLGPGTGASYTNQDNGLWAFSVSAVDEVGNIGAPAKIYFKTNKYIPHTYITYLNARQDEQGYLSISIIGRGFADGGLVRRVILDRDGQEPYDREFLLSRGEYQVFSDREIGNLRIADIEEGLYRVILDHPLRGLYMTPPQVSVDKMGTVKFGDYLGEWKPSWSLRKVREWVFDTSTLIIIAVIVFCVLGLTASIRGIGSVVAESAAIRLETIALITGDIMPSEKKKRMTVIKRRGAGLRLKMASFTIVLVLLVVLMISLPMALMMTRTQEETLLKGLLDRSTVLLEGLVSSARSYMPSNNILELSYLPAQSTVIPEAKYVTITGYGSANDIYNDHVMATNDDSIGSKIDTPSLQSGVSRLTDELTPRIEEIARELNVRAQAEVGELSASITALNEEARDLVNRSDQDSIDRFNRISVTTQQLQIRVNERLAGISREIGSAPAFSTVSLDSNNSRTFIFFKPVMYRQGTDTNYFRGLIRLEVSIDSIVENIAGARWSLIRVIIIVALAALALGAIGALVLSTLIIRPIIKLVSHVERIRDTEDKTKLEGVEIEIKSKDEIAVLGNTINDMTHGLVKAAQAASDLSIGKEIQKKFIPLEVNREGNKLSSGFKDTKNVQFFGYYEGAKGVSGDYFDYQDLDGRYFAIIKCDVAGKGIPAALIMIQVATMFLNYFKQWKPTEKGMHIEEVVYQINDFIETLGFKGRFAAFTLLLFDSQTGVARFCNAGDNIIHWYDASEQKMKTITLKETPATGVLPNFLVESKGGYMVQTLTIDHGDILFLYTDGIEEAKRRFRDLDYREIICGEGEKDTPHATHTVGQGDEEMGPDRVEAIINSVMNKKVYTLHKYHNPEGENNELRFDFTTCEGKLEEAIMAMVSVEKMFRLYKDPKADADARVLVDKKVDEFLKQHFTQYRNYCLDTRENPGNDAYMYYTHVREDDQYDDLTILGINRK